MYNKNLNNDIAQFLLMLAKQNNYSNETIKNIQFVAINDINIYSNSNNHDDNTQIYCVYADFINKNNKNNDVFTAEFYFSVEYSKYYNDNYSILDVYFLYYINEH